MIRNYIIGLSIIFFALSGIITFKTLGIPTKSTHYQNNLKELKLKTLSSEPADISEQNYEEQDADEALIKELQAKIAILKKKLSDKNMETQANIESGPEEHDVSGNINTQMDKNLSKELFLYSRPDDKEILKQKMSVDPQYASRIIYTIQTGSHTKKADAEEEFNSILKALNKKEYDYLRIEKIGNFYTVRLGKFDDYRAAEKFLNVIKTQLYTAVILKAYIKDDRIIRLYSHKESTF